MSRLKIKYQEVIVPKLTKELGIKNKLGVPKIVKIVINQGIGEVAKNKEQLLKAKQVLAALSGQTPQVKKARISVASFDVRLGMVVGLKVTLRGDRMYEFLDRLISIVMPRIRDFRGVPKKSFDKNGNYTLGIEDVSVFPEVDAAKIVVKGMEITLVVNSKDVKSAQRLFELIGMPFEKNNK